MKRVGIFLVFPLLSVILVSLYAAGKVSKTAAIALLIVSFVVSTLLIVLRRKA